MPTIRTGDCPVCSHVLRLPLEAVGKKVQCRASASTLAIMDGPGERYDLMLVRRGDGADVPAHAAGGESPGDVAAAAGDAAAADAQCPECGAGIAAGDAYCGACGADLVAARKAEYREQTARRQKSRANAMRHATTRRAAGWLLALAVLFVIGTVAQGVLMQRDVSAAHRHLAAYEDTELLMIDGESITVGALRQQIDLEVALSWGIGLGLAVVMAGLYVWAKRSPFPAILTGLCTFLVVVVINALVDPTTIANGIIVKVLAITGLLGGLKAALAERGAAVHRVRRAR